MVRFRALEIRRPKLPSEGTQSKRSYSKGDISTASGTDQFTAVSLSRGVKVGGHEGGPATSNFKLFQQQYRYKNYKDRLSVYCAFNNYMQLSMTNSSATIFQAKSLGLTVPPSARRCKFRIDISGATPQNIKRARVSSVSFAPKSKLRATTQLRFQPKLFFTFNQFLLQYFFCPKLE